MRYELISAKPTVSRNMYDLTVKPIPETILESLKFAHETTYHGRDNEWYQLPDFKPCTDSDLCEKLSKLYEKAKNTPEPQPTHS